MPEIDKTFPSFLAKAYKYKELSDYSIGPDAVITMGEADDAIEKAAYFIDYVASLLEKPSPKDT